MNSVHIKKCSNALSSRQTVTYVHYDKIMGTSPRAFIMSVHFTAAVFKCMFIHCCVLLA